MPPGLLAATEGMVIAGETLEGAGDGSVGRTWLATVSDAEANEIVAGPCYWDGLYLVPPLAASGGSVLVENDDGLVVCSPGEEVRVVAGRSGAQATSVIDGRVVALVATDDGLQYMDLETMVFDPFTDLQIGGGVGAEWPSGASHGTGVWMVAMESTDGPMQDRVRRLVFFDDAGGLLELDAPFVQPPANPRLAAAALSSDGTTLYYAEEYPNGSTDLVSWDLAASTEFGRMTVLDAFEPGDDPYGFGRPYVRYIDVGPASIMVGLATVEAEHYLSGLLIVGANRSVTELSEGDDWRVVAASFLNQRH